MMIASEKNIGSMNRFKKPLLPIFDEKVIIDLYEDYLDVEKQWENFFNRIDVINLVIIGEAPLSKDKYIYNPEKNHDSGSSFLSKKDLKKCLGIYKKSEHLLEDEGKMELMVDLGIIIIEAFPYGLNEDKHANSNFKNLSSKKKKQLFSETSSWHFYNKIKKIDSKTSPQTSYAFRYIGNMKDLNKLINIDKEIHCLGGKSFEIDTKKLISLI